MKKYPKVVQCDKRGQIVIPKDIRNELKIDEGTGFWMYSLAGNHCAAPFRIPGAAPHVNNLRSAGNTPANWCRASRESLRFEGPTHY